MAIYDATNTTKERRDWILKELSDLIPSRSQIVFVESVVNDESLVDHNVREVKISMPDYSGMKEDEAVVGGGWLCFTVGMNVVSDVAFEGNTRNINNNNNRPISVRGLPRTRIDTSRWALTPMTSS